ncbi:PREDICTED: uncharacterized protein LOC109586322 [Amphimedon queenslandica]|uniref:Uncharacterized protein n=1 Tax=Amphimedon queenslandica TaxID=400682 RepID=A0AAN0JM34_AMPQE|nr:PREDICTED: uncharacterized protein LOC109586322 [Amphimedon queenslandica]|eukprot:XP_019858060.1 PREDICTED: uncharacterized protein LOC109586322 [Amphimedon queenslandica]
MDGITVPFEKLKIKERELQEKILKEQRLRQKISEKEYQINQLNRQIEIYTKKSTDMKERIQKAGEIPQSILERRKVMKAESIKWLYDRCISIIEENLKAQLKNVCQCSTSVDSGEMVAFKVYGLLLSACQQETIVEKVTKSVEDENILGKNESSKEVAKVYVKQAVNVTYSMLTLLPPLIVTVHPREYSEVLHDTNRLTWDESTERIDELIYYRPILMYGNHLNVAVKGLVGNSKRELLQKQQSTQELISYETKAIDARENFTGNNCAVCHNLKYYDFIDCKDAYGQHYKVHQECYMCIVCSAVYDVKLYLVGSQLFCKRHLKICKD